MNQQQREIAFRIDPVLWAKTVLGITPQEWQEPFCGPNVGPTFWP